MYKPTMQTYKRNNGMISVEELQPALKMFHKWKLAGVDQVPN